MMTTKSSSEKPGGFLPVITGESSIFSSRGQPREVHHQYRRSDGGIVRFPTVFSLVSILILVLCVLSCVMVLYQNAKIMEQNFHIYEQQIKLQAKLFIGDGNDKLEYDPSDDNDWLLDPTFRVRRSLPEPPEGCPPCATEKPPNPIEPHRNPVSVLNEEVGKKAQYTVLWLCEDPHIHQATLVIDDHNFQGKSWAGKGRNQQLAKQAAAWSAIQLDFPHLADLVGEEYKPPSYNPPCKQPPSPLLHA